MNSKFYNLPKNIEFCKLCVISNQRPSSVVEFKHTINQKKPTIQFEHGVCSACNYKKINLIHKKLFPISFVNLK